MIGIYVWGRKAQFTIPHLRADPVTYSVPTPSAMKGVVRALYWKPEFEYVVRRIDLVKAGTLTTEKFIGVRQSVGRPGRAVVTSTILRDVAYVVWVDVEPNKARTDRTARSYVEEARKRIETGQQWRQPCLGRREYTAYARLAQPTDQPDRTIQGTVEALLWDNVPLADGKDGAIPIFFDAQIRDGALVVPGRLWRLYRDRFFDARMRLHAAPRQERA